MTTTTTTYMVLILPVPSSEIGPVWAAEIVTAFNRVDLHDHSTGNGVQVTPAGLNINSDLDIGGNHVEVVKSLRLQSQAAVLVTADDVGSVYRVGNNLWYNNSSGANVQITNGTGLNVSGSGVITASTPGAYPYTVLTGDAQTVLLIDTTSARTLNLPAASNAMFFMIKDAAGSAGTNNISVAPNGTDTIEGVNGTFALNYDRGSWGLVSDGVSAWHVV